MNRRLLFLIMAFAPMGVALADHVERSFSLDPTTAVICVSTGAGGDTLDRYEYRIFGDGRIAAQRFNGENRSPLNSWSAYLSHEELADLERDVIDSKLYAFDEERQRAAIAAKGPQPHTADAPALKITVTLQEGPKGSPTEVSRSFSLRGGAGFAHKHKDIPEYGAAHRLMKLLTRAEEPTAQGGS